jgi:hypothetical protein
MRDTTVSSARYSQMLTDRLKPVALSKCLELWCRSAVLCCYMTMSVHTMLAALLKPSGNSGRNIGSSSVQFGSSRFWPSPVWSTQSALSSRRITPDQEVQEAAHGRLCCSAERAYTSLCNSGPSALKARGLY